MGWQTIRNSPGWNIGNNLFNHFFAIDINKIERKLHEERVDAFTWDNPQTLVFAKALVLQKTDRTFGAGFSGVDGIADDSAARYVANRVLIQCARTYSIR